MITLVDGLGIPESPRWHDGRLWFGNWLTGDIVAVDPSGTSEVVAHLDTTIPYSIDWLPDGTLLAVSGQEAALLRLERDGSWTTYADLSSFGSVFNEIVVAADGSAYVNGSNVVLVGADRSVREVASGIDFGNGMAIAPDGHTLVVAESHGARLTAFTIRPDGTLQDRRVWADLDGDAPDGICLAADGSIWYASVPRRQCVRVREGGEVVQRVEVDRGCFACALGGDDGGTLFICAAEWLGMERMAESSGSGRILAVASP